MNDTDTPRRIMTVAEVAEYLQVSKATILRMARKGKIPAFKIGADWRFDRDAIDKWTTGRTSEVLKKRSAAARAAPKKTGMDITADELRALRIYALQHDSSVPKLLASEIRKLLKRK